MSSIARQIAARVHGRYLVDEPGGRGARPLLVGFHGYAERAEHMLDALRRIRGDRDWLLVSVQALHPFYTRGGDVVANWMTSADRELAIADNLQYVASVVAEVRGAFPTTETIVYAGFSQGAAMAYRAAAFAHQHAACPAPAGAVILAGDVPPDVAPVAGSLPPLVIGRGREDGWYTEEKAAADLAVLERAGRTPEVHVFDGGHVWDASFVDAAAGFLDRVNRLV